MGELVSIVTPLHRATKRDYIGRMLDNKVEAMRVARKYEFDYWDGDRRYGYGGYSYQPGRWAPVARALIERYDLKRGDSVLDLGCGKGFLLYELQLAMPGLTLIGLDRSEHALAHKHESFTGLLRHHDIRHPLPFKENDFDLVVSICCAHNLRVAELSRFLPEVERVGRRAYLQTESFRDEQEWFNLVAWCLTAETILRPEDWQFLFQQYGYSGDYEFVYFD